MNRDMKHTRIGRIVLALALTLTAIMTHLPAPAYARGAGAAGLEARAVEAIWEEAGTGADDEIERWWGVLGAALCGAEIRLIRFAPAIGMNPYALAAGISGCLLATLDIMTTK